MQWLINDMGIFHGIKCSHCGAKPPEDNEMKLYECTEGHWSCIYCVNDYGSNHASSFEKRCPKCGKGATNTQSLWGEIKY